MYITTVDEDRAGPVHLEVTDAIAARMDQLRGFFRANPHILSRSGRPDASRYTAKDEQNANNFAVSVLAYLENKVYEKQYSPEMFEILLGACINFSAPEGATTVEYEVMDMVGMGRPVGPDGGDIPYADVASARVQIPIAIGGVGYKYTVEDLANAAYSGRPLPMKRMGAAQTAWRRHMNFVALQGEAQKNFTGLFNNAGVTAANRPSGSVWDAATADTIVADLTAGFSAVRVATKNNDAVTCVALPTASIERMQIPRSTNSDVTVLEFMKRTREGCRFIAVDELSTLGSGGTKRAVFFNPTDENMVLHLPLTQRFLAPQYQDLTIKVPGYYKYAGLNIRRTPSTYYMDGI